MNAIHTGIAFLSRGLAAFSTDVQSHLSPLGVAALFVFAGACIAFAVATGFSRSRRELDEMLRPYRSVAMPIDPVKAGLADTVRPIMRRAGDLLVGFAETRGKRLALEQMLVRSGLPVAPGEFLLACAGVVLVAGVVGFVVASIGGMLVAVVLASVGPLAFVQIRAGRRHRSFDGQLPDILKIVASSLRGGFSLLQGLTSVADQCPDPMREELQIAISRIRLGEAIEDALNDVADRTGSQDFRWTVMAIRIQREVGGNLAGILDTVASTMLERERIRREVRTLTAEGRMSAGILAAMPVALGAFIFVMNRPYIELLFGSFSGRLALGVGAVMEILGGVWMYRTIQIAI